MDRRLLHVVGSPPQDRRYTVREFWSAVRGDSYERIEEVGGRGGVAIPHGYRMGQDADELWRQEVDLGWVDPRRGKWQFVRSITDDWGDMQAGLVKPAPHMHGLVPSCDFDGDAAADLPGDWVVHNVRSLAPIYLREDDVPWRYRAETEQSAESVVREGFEDMARLLMYLLSHAAVQIPVGDPDDGGLGGRATVTYFGDVHPNAFDPAKHFGGRELALIEQRAAEAVAAVVGDGDGEDGETCGREGCEAEVVPLCRLDDYLADVEWFEGLEAEQQWEIWGLSHWSGQRPPPGGGEHSQPPGGSGRSASVSDSVRADGETLVEWLRRVGRARLGQNPWYRASASVES